jgi:2-keto-3-deoxy-L-rhamnonate aldolase RhmA
VAVTSRLQERLARGEVGLCMATRLARTAEIAMIADSCGFDAFFIDMEHSTITLDAAGQICTAALPVGVTPLVRIAGHNFEDATRLLDMGALGIVCPNIGTRAQAETFVDACRFPPQGTRSVAGPGPLQGHRSAKSTARAMLQPFSSPCWRRRKASPMPTPSPPCQASTCC